MKMLGGCYCKAIRYEAVGEPILKAECYCRECQYITGGGAALVMAVPAEGFLITQGKTKAFTRPDLAGAVTREFCPDCGTQLFTRAPTFPQGIILKVGSLDDPAIFGKAKSGHFAGDAQSFHRLPTDMPVYQRWSD